ncbi:MAG: hypothetical protein HZA95_00255 [Candidatus Vogelbacteria bacterium]|nr:hypothetical protein [Candidatus Vogelbacteria bacterium]
MDKINKGSTIYDYLVQAVRSGRTEQAKKDLLSSGYMLDSVEAALKEIGVELAPESQVQVSSVAPAPTLTENTEVTAEVVQPTAQTGKTLPNSYAEVSTPKPIEPIATQVVPEVPTAPVKVAPTAPVGAPLQPLPPLPSKPKNHGFLKFLAILIVVLIVLIIGIGGASYYVYGWFIPPIIEKYVPAWIGGTEYSREELFPAMFEHFSDIKSSSFVWTASFRAEPYLDAPRVPEIKYDKLNADKEIYARDVQNINDLRTILYALESRNRYKSPFPVSLGSLNLKLKNAQAFSYTKVGTGFLLKLNIESDAAKYALEKLSPKLFAIGSNTISLTEKNLSDYIYLQGEIQRPSLLAMIDSQKEALGLLSKEVKGSVGFEGAMDINAMKLSTTTLPDGWLKIIGDLALGDSTYNVDVEGISKDNVLFGRINKMPSIPFFGFDLSTIKGKWIQVPSSDLNSSSISALGVTPYASEYNEIARNKALTEEQSLEIFKKAMESGLLRATFITVEPSNEGRLYKYLVAVDAKNLADFYENISKKIEQKYRDKALFKYDKTTSEFMKSDAYLNAMKYLNQAIKLNVWIDPESAQFRKMTLVYKAAAPENYPKADLQAVFETSYSIANVNQKQDIETPENFITTEEVERLISGKTVEQFEMDKQSYAVLSVRKTLAGYRESGRPFPFMLAELTEDFPTTTVKSNLTYHYLDPYGVGPLKEIPNDRYTKLPFIYSSTGEDYRLQYQMRLPKDTGDTSSANSYDNYSSSYLNGQFVEGLNTATSKTMSEEVAKSQKNKSKTR